MIQVQYKSFGLKTLHPFGTAHGKRLETPAVLIRVHYLDKIGYGEASMPPYYPETQESVIQFIKKVNLERFESTSELSKILNHIHSYPNNFAAKNALDSALHDAWARSKTMTLEEALLGKLTGTKQNSSFTIGLDDIDIMLIKCKEATDYKTLKIKLNGENDIEVIETIRSQTLQELMVDANQSWKSVKEAITKSKQLHELGVTLIEQPFQTGKWKLNELLKEESPIPIIADEDMQSIEDLDLVARSFDGINVKLMKCGGVSEALALIEKGRTLGLKIMIGCMTETSCGISASCQLASLADYLDLDGNLLLANDPYVATASLNGLISVDPSQYGIGLIDNSSLWNSRD